MIESRIMIIEILLEAAAEDFEITECWRDLEFSFWIFWELSEEVSADFLFFCKNGYEGILEEFLTEIISLLCWVGQYFELHE